MKIFPALSHCFLEIHFWEVHNVHFLHFDKHISLFFVQVAVDIFTVVLVGKLIEPLWGALEMMTFFFIINTGNVLLVQNLIMINIHCSSQVLLSSVRFSTTSST